ncbi:MAG: TIGR04283 family arsenosugar biosynthesis glycosyltransferase [Deltaproteobacteria bacterium]|nr:TIGR04283 family arsenosugar biosynthesis glycosyltransferase [Deltaproteobacteria bacterium]
MAGVGETQRPSIGIVIPTLDEEARIGARLEQLRLACGFDRIVVSDGGSRDDTVAIACSHPDVVVVEAPRGRAHQMNRGAEALAEVDTLCFVHADVSLPHDAGTLIRRALADPAVVAGAFKTWTVADCESRPWWSPLLHLADVRSRYTGLPYGDQALFVRREIFTAIGGFPEQPLMEDLELSRRLRRRGRIVRVPACVRVSGRRFIERPLFFTAVVNVFPLLYKMGVSPTALRRLYDDIR